MADGQQHHLDAGLAGATQRPTEPVAAADGLEHEREHACLGVLDDVVHEVRGGGHQLLTRRHREVEAETQPRAQQRGEHRAGVGDQ